jgi:hypothetical protein
LPAGDLALAGVQHLLGERLPRQDVLELRGRVGALGERPRLVVLPDELGARAEIFGPSSIRPPTRRVSSQPSPSDALWSVTFALRPPSSARIASAERFAIACASGK